jgi:spermidine synthase
MDKLKTGWFSEFESGHSFSLECNKILYKSKSKFQDILVFNKYS